MKTIQLKFAEPTIGFWDGGKKDGGIFEPNLHNEKDIKPGDELTWGCIDLNFWFRCKTGRTYQTALSYAIKKLKRFVSVPCTITAIE